MIRFVKALTACALVLGLATPAFSIFGLGAHYGFDVSLTMPDKINEQISFTGLSMNTAGFTGSLTGLPSSFLAKDLPLFVERSNFKASPINFGLKLYVDVIPFIDAIEVSSNFGIWEYESRLRYPKSIVVNDTPITSLLSAQSRGFVSITEDTVNLTLEGNNMAFFGLSKTPYAKIQLEVNLRKYIKIPLIDNFIKPYFGLGAHCNLATPAVSTGLINDAIGTKLNSPLAMTGIATVLANPDNQKAIMEEIFKKMMTPHFGAQVLVGTIIKPPIIPFGIYVDGKYIIPFEAYDIYADVKGMGFLVNAGIVLHI